MGQLMLLLLLLPGFDLLQILRGIFVEVLFATAAAQLHFLSFVRERVRLHVRVLADFLVRDNAGFQRIGLRLRVLRFVTAARRPSVPAANPASNTAVMMCFLMFMFFLWW